MTDRTCYGCEARIEGDEYHRSSWASVPVVPGDTHLRAGDPLCSACHLALWAETKQTVRMYLRKRKGSGVNQVAPYMDNKLYGPHVEEIFRKVVVAGSPPAVDQSSTD